MTTDPMLHGGRIVARALKNEGVSHVFTLCGGHVQNIYDGCLDEGIRVVDVRHEQTAGHAADGWARVTGQPGVCIVTAGPGVTDVVTAAANAMRASVPLIIIGGAGPIALRHMGSLQDMDHVDLMKPITKWSASVTETRRLEEFVATAFRVATTGLPGPVFLEMPIDVLMNYAAESQIVRPTHYRTAERPAPSPSAIQQTVELLTKAQRPVLVLGSQLRWSGANATVARTALSAFLDRFPVPTFLNGLARGALEDGDPCMFTRSRKFAIAESDVLVICGTPFDFRLEYGRVIPDTTTVIQVDLDPTEIGRNHGAHVGIPADTGAFLTAVAGALPKKDGSAWLAQVCANEDKSRAKMRLEAESDVSPPNPLRVCAELAKFVDEDTIVVGDGGDFVATAAYSLPIRWPGVWMDPGPLGTLGVGPGYAMAAKLARPASKVIIVYGDGSFGLHAMEFEAMARQGIKVVGVIGNDAAWTQILRGQRDMFGDARTPATKLAYTRYDLVAEAVGGRGFYVERAEDIRPALEAAFACAEPALVNVKIGSSDFRKGAISV